MNQTLMTVAASTAAVLALACQPKTKTKVVEVPKKDKVYDFTRETTGNPVLVPVYDAACNSQRGLRLTNSIINEAYMGVETLYINTVIEDEVFENAQYRDIFRETHEFLTVSEGQRVYLCRDASTIAATTQEGAAIRMKADVDTAYGLYQAVKTKKTLALPFLNPIDLHAAQLEKEIRRHVDRDDEATEYTSYLTDNASFMGGGETPALISYPQSELSKELKLLGGVPLWLVPGVFQHEFGHYVFDSVMNEDGIAFASYQDYVQKNPRLHLFHTPPSTFAHIAANPGLRAGFIDFMKSRDFFIGALNEGFADLWAYYSLKQPADLFNVSCFSKNRNVASAFFYNGMSKTWNENLWNRAVSAELDDDDTESSDPISSCSQPYFSGIHTIGAAMAHTADAVFTAAARTHSATTDTSLLKAEMAIAWLQSIKASNEFQDLGGKASLSRILNLAVGTGIRYQASTDKTAFCAVVNETFPVLIKRWKDARTDNEDVSSVVSFCSFS